MFRRPKVAYGLKYAWLNFLGYERQLKALCWLSKAESLHTTLHFNQSIQGFRKALLILPEKPLDLILTQKSIVALKNHRPDISVEVIAESGGADIVRSNPYIDGGVFYNSREFYFNHPAFRELLYTLKGKQVDACFLFNRDRNPLHLFLMAQSAAPLRVSLAGEAVSPFVNLSIRPRQAAVYEGDQYESLLKTLGVKVARSRLKWNIAKSTEKDVEALLVQAGFRIEQPLIGIDVSPSLNGREFPLDLLKGLIQALTGLNNAEIILFHSKERDSSLVKNLSFYNRNVISIPEDKIGFASTFIYKCDLIIALNNLIYQLAVMLDRPAVGLFEEAEVARWACPEKGRFESVSAPKLRNIGLEEVVAKARTLLTPTA
jgi:ADP-heptose:LPS heptosyltransferase